MPLSRIKAGLVCCLGPPRSRHQDVIRCTRDFEGEVLVKDKWEEARAARKNL